MAVIIAGWADWLAILLAVALVAVIVFVVRHL